MAIKTTRNFHGNSDRYHYDFKVCPNSEGWAQFDTTQDASYYGNWVNPFMLSLCSYAEGDIAFTECDTVEEFIAEVRASMDWHGNRFVGIDPGFNERLESKLQAMGLLAEVAA